MKESPQIVSISIDSKQLEQLVKMYIKESIDSYVKTEKLFYTIKDLRDKTGLSESKVYKSIVSDKRLPKYKEGTKWLFDKEETDKFLKIWLLERKIG